MAIVNFILLPIVFLFLVSLMPSQSVPFASLQPVIGFNQNFIEIGNVRFVPNDNNSTGSEFSKTYNLTLKAMNRILPNSYSVFCGYRQLDIITLTQSQGQNGFAVFVSNVLPTSVNLRGRVTVANKFVLLWVNYMCVYETLVTSQLIYGQLFVEDTQHIVSSSTTLLFPRTFSIPASGYKQLYSIQRLNWARHDNVASYKSVIKFSITSAAAGTIDINVYFSYGGVLKKFSLLILFISDAMFLTAPKKSLMLSYVVYPTFQTNSPIYSYSITLTHDVLENTFFIALKELAASDISYHYQVYADPIDKIIKGNTYYLGSGLIYRGIAYYGYTCPEKYALDQSSWKCLPCQQNCLTCIFDTIIGVICVECVTNFNLMPGGSACNCDSPGMTVITSVCDDFNALNLSDCIIASRNVSVNCHFCSPQLFKQEINNLCDCVHGYDDNDGDGQCQQTCGDGQLFRAECDDGNQDENDGCSSFCTIEPGFVCDDQKPSKCKTLIPLRNRIILIQKLQGHQVQVRLELMNFFRERPFPVFIQQLQPEQIYVKLFLFNQETSSEEIQIKNLRIIALDQPYELVLQFEYEFTIEGSNSRLVFNYSKTKYLNDSQEIQFQMKGSTTPLIFTKNLETFKTISIVICVATALGMLSLLIGLLTAKFIGVQTILTLQLIFYSQLLITDPSKIPIGFLFLKYLKFASGYNDFIELSSYKKLTMTSIKFSQIQMQKIFIENFNFNFLLLLMSFFVFLITFTIKRIYETRLIEIQNGIKQAPKYEFQELTKSLKQTQQKTELWIGWNDRSFYMLSNFSVWLVLPLSGAVSSQILIENQLTSFSSTNQLAQLLLKLNPTVAIFSFLIILSVGFNHFCNIFLSQGVSKKILYKPQQLTYKRLLFIYLIVIGSLVFFFNQIQVYRISISVLALVVQLIFTLAVIVVRPYRQSLRVHQITLIMNLLLYIVFLLIVNFINLIQPMDQDLIILFGYLLTGFCGFLLLLTVVRLYYELRYGQALEKKIQKQRQQEQQLKKILQQEKLNKLKKKLQQDAKNKKKLLNNDRLNNCYLYQNQVNQDLSKDLVQWLQKRNWQAQKKQKYYFERYSQKPLDWIQKNDKQTFQKIIQIKNQTQITRKKSTNGGQLANLTGKLKKEGNQYAQSWNRELEMHNKKLKKHMNYAMAMMKGDSNLLVQRQYQLKD